MRGCPYFGLIRDQSKRRFKTRGKPARSVPERYDVSPTVITYQQEDNFELQEFSASLFCLTSLFFLERARSGGGEQLDYFGLHGAKAFVAQPDGSITATLAVLVPAGKWFVQGMAQNLDNCMGAPSFEAEGGSTVYLGTFDATGNRIKVDTGETAQSAALSSSNLTAMPANWINGFTYICRPMSMYALEFENFPYEATYHWGSRSGSSPAPPIPALGEPK